MSTTDADFQRLKDKVLIKRHILQEIIRKHGKKNLYDYAYQYVTVNLNSAIKKRQDEFFVVLGEELTKRFNGEIAASALRQLEKYYFVSTADHHGPVTHPFFLNSNLLTALPYPQQNDPALNNIIVFSCANVALNNSSFPRGLLFNAYAKGQLQMHRLPFVPNTGHAYRSYNFPAYAQKDVEKTKKMLREKVSEGEVSQKHADKIFPILDEVYNKPELFECETYMEQVSKTNFHLWHKFFEPTNMTPPNLLYLEVETLVVRLLIKHHLYQDTILNHILFDPEYEPFINQYFEGIFGSFTRQDQSGTYLFWALPKGQKYVMQLWRKGNFLVSKDESYKIELRPDVIQKAMEERELIPSLLLDYATVCFYYGLKCLGGFNQVNYLTLMKNAYIKMNADLGNYRSIEVSARAQTKEICDGLCMAFLGYEGGKMALATGMDFILYGNEKTWPTCIEVSKSITVEEALNPLMPEIYRISYDESEWESDLISITDSDINTLTGLDTKIKPCLEID